MIGPIGGTELFIILGIIVLLFGSTAIPKVAKSIGLAKKEFEKGLNEDEKAKQKKAIEEAKKIKRRQ